jgi:hypothetical protein
VRISAIDLRAHVKHLAHMTRNSTTISSSSRYSSSYLSPAPPPPLIGNPGPLPLQRWEIPTGIGPRDSGVCCGLQPPDLYTLLCSSTGNSSMSSSALYGSSGSSSSGFGSSLQQSKQSKLRLLTSGVQPMLAAFEVEEHPHKGALALLASYASSMTSGVIGAASRAASFGPSLLSQGRGWTFIIRLIVTAP